MGKNRIKITEKSRVFYKLYGVNILITMVFICLISVVCSVASSKLILDNFMAYNQDMIAEKSNVLDEKIRQLDEACNLTIGEENVFRFIMTDELEYEKPTKLLLIMRHLKNICSGNSLIDEVSLIDCSREIVLTEKTKIKLEDKAEWEKYQEEKTFLITEDSGIKRLEFVKRFEPIRGKKVVYMILTVNQEALFSNLLIGGESTMLESYLFAKDGTSLSVNDSENITLELRKYLLSMSDYVGGYENKNQKLILYKNPSRISDIAMVAVQDYTYLERQTKSLKQTIIIISLLMIVFASIIIYLYSLYLYHPIKNLGSKIQGISREINGKPMRDEFRLLDQMVDAFQNEKAYTEPMVIRDSIQKLVRESFDRERFEYLKEIFHQSMEYSGYILIVTKYKTEDPDKERGKKFLKHLSEEPEIDGFYTEITGDRSIGIFNTDLDYDVFVRRADEIKREEEKGKTPFICCISREFKNLESMNLVYLETLNSVEKAIFIGKLTLVYGNVTGESDKKDRYKKEEENRLIRYMVEGKEEEALVVLSSITESLRDNSEDIQYTRFLYFQVCRNIVKSAEEMGVKLPIKCGEKELFQEIFQTETIQKLEEFKEKLFYICLECFEKKEKGYSVNVEKAIGFIESNYMQELSIDDVAASVFLSSGYLSIIFKEETGYTILEYITHVRMKKAGELLRSHSEWKIKDVAEQLGYNNVQSFIRFFKKYYGQTPAAYRKGDNV